MAKSRRLAQQPFRHMNALVSGGSKGIGRATAREIVLLGGSVCLIARDPGPLADAAAEMKGLVRHPEQFIETMVCDATDMAALQPQIEEFVQRRGVPHYLVNSVGYAYPQYVERLTLDDFRRNMDANYYGQLVPILCLLPHFMKARRGHIANVASVLGFMGLMGYAAYTPTKHAIVGLTAALRHELKPYHISFSLLFPPDTDTPGFAIENRSKPPETALMSATSKLMSAEAVAEVFVEGLRKRQYEILPGDARLFRLVDRLAPGLGRFIADRTFVQARKRLGK